MQGVFLDTDGSLVNSNNFPADLLPADIPAGAGATWHSAVESQLFNTSECVYVRGRQTANDGAWCSPALTFRRVMLNGHGPAALASKDLLLTSRANNRTSIVHFTRYNEDGYQFTVATQRDYWIQWNLQYRLDAEQYRWAVVGGALGVGGSSPLLWVSLVACVLGHTTNTCMYVCKSGPFSRERPSSFPQHQHTCAPSCDARCG